MAYVHEEEAGQREYNAEEAKDEGPRPLDCRPEDLIHAVKSYFFNTTKAHGMLIKEVSADGMMIATFASHPSWERLRFGLEITCPASLPPMPKRPNDRTKWTKTRRCIRWTSLRVSSNPVGDFLMQRALLYAGITKPFNQHVHPVTVLMTADEVLQLVTFLNNVRLCPGVHDEEVQELASGASKELHAELKLRKEGGFGVVGEDQQPYKLQPFLVGLLTQKTVKNGVIKSCVEAFVDKISSYLPEIANKEDPPRHWFSFRAPDCALLELSKELGDFMRTTANDKCRFCSTHRHKFLRMRLRPSKLAEYVMPEAKATGTAGSGNEEEQQEVPTGKEGKKRGAPEDENNWYAESLKRRSVSNKTIENHPELLLQKLQYMTKECQSRYKQLYQKDQTIKVLKDEISKLRG